MLGNSDISLGRTNTTQSSLDLPAKASSFLAGGVRILSLSVGTIMRRENMSPDAVRDVALFYIAAPRFRSRMINKKSRKSMTTPSFLGTKFKAAADMSAAFSMSRYHAPQSLVLQNRRTSSPMLKTPRLRRGLFLMCFIWRISSGAMGSRGLVCQS